MVGKVLFWVLAAQLAPEDAYRQALDARARDEVGVAEARWSEALSADPGDDFATLSLGFLAYATYRPQEAIAHFESVARASEDPRFRAWSRYGIGLVHLFSGAFGDAHGALLQAEQAARELADTVLVVRASAGRVGATSRIVGFPAALALADSIAPWVRPSGAEQPIYLCARSGVDPSVESAELVAAADRAEALGAIDLAGRCSFQTLVRWTQRGATDSVWHYAGVTTERLAAARDLHTLATVDQWVGFYARSIGQLARAEARLTRAIEVGTESGNGPAVAWSWLNRAQLAASLGVVADGLAAAEEARVLLEEQGDLWGLSSLLGVEGRLWMRSRNPIRARETYRQALDMAERLGSDDTALGVTYGLVETALVTGDVEEAARLADAYVRRVEERGMDGWRRAATSLLAEVAVASGRLAVADSLLESIRYMERFSTDEARFLNQLAGVKARLGRLDEASRLAFMSADMLDRWRERSEDIRIRLHALQRDSGDRGVATVVSALAAAGRHEEAFALSERRRARELLAQLDRVEAYDSTGVAIEVEPTPVGLAEARSMLDPNTAVLSITTGDGEPTTVILVTDALTLSWTASAIDSLRPLATRLVTLAEQGGGFEDPARQLADELLAPTYEALPTSVDRLLVVAEDELQRVPVDLLPAPRGSVVDRFAVVVAPSASVVHSLRVNGPTGVRAGRILALGDPTVSAAGLPPQVVPTGGLPPLPGARREARLVGRFGTESTVRTRAGATETLLKEADLASYDVVHIAAHAFVDVQSSARTSIALAATSTDDGVLTPGELATLALDGSLVVLSTCSSGGGVPTRGEGLQGLTAPILAAGADAVVATLWRVDDDAVLPLVAALYEGMADGLDVGEALRSAKLEARDRGVPAAAWAAFVVVGDDTAAVDLHRPARWTLVWTLGAVAVVVILLVARISRGRIPA